MTARPEIWCELDGTPIELIARTNPDHWSRYHLDELNGYIAFLDGVELGGVKVAGVASRRRAMRRLIDRPVVQGLGFDRYFNSSVVAVNGSDRRKGTMLADLSRNRAIGLVEDKPHKVGRHLLNAMIRNSEESGAEQIVTVGVTDGITTTKRIERFYDMATGFGRQVAVSERQGSVTVEGEDFQLQVVRLEPFSLEAGQHFARILNPPAA